MDEPEDRGDEEMQEESSGEEHPMEIGAWGIFVRRAGWQMLGV